MARRTLRKPTPARVATAQARATLPSITVLPISLGDLWSASPFFALCCRMLLYRLSQQPMPKSTMIVIETALSYHAMTTLTESGSTINRADQTKRSSTRNHRRSTRGGPGSACGNTLRPGACARGGI
ncbi:hypothetical protein N657DRAFT_407036 [Parathielavia appendiculata]|uniref:Uncharacterized protein n=1 Tax=Parathielavia appendiculata TaxID=2587402 RepID=A0AAN6TPC3_9PEZI|nr:hypothetical protein N657DRAFT_407036 [Parathielavia appendiculata]